MGLFARFKAGLQKTHNKLTHELKRIISRSPRLDAVALEELEAALIGADLGMPITLQIIEAVKRGYETQGGAGLDVFAVARREVENSLSMKGAELRRAPAGPTVVSIVGVNGTGKTTTAAKLAHLVQGRDQKVLLAAKQCAIRSSTLGFTEPSSRRRYFQNRRFTALPTAIPFPALSLRLMFDAPGSPSMARPHRGRSSSLSLVLIL